MRICFIADARSPIAQNWIRYFTQPENDVEVIVVSTAIGDKARIPEARVEYVPLGAGRLATSPVPQSNRQGHLRTSAREILLGNRSHLRWLLARGVTYVSALDAMRQGTGLHAILRDLRPDLIHAMRIPYEGLLAAASHYDACPLVVSVWGNDFTLHAARSRLIRSRTRRLLHATSALMTDCQRDLALARLMGFPADRPSLVVPGSGGVQRSLFSPDRSNRETTLESLHIPPDAKIVINPRGVREYIRNDLFFQAVPLVLKDEPNAYFICTGMAGNKVAEQMVETHSIRSNIRLLPVLSQRELARLFQVSDVMVSPSVHDGTPNSLLEAMACGCFPVVSDIPTMHEWIIHGENGLIFVLASPSEMASAIVHSLQNTQLINRAFIENQRLIDMRADYDQCMIVARQFYQQLIS